VRRAVRLGRGAAGRICPAHSPTRSLDTSALGRAGGVASGEARRELGKSVRELLREKVEAEAEAVGTAFHDGLVAVTPHGEPDAKTRVLAAQGLLAEAYGPPAQAATVEVSGPEGRAVSIRARPRLPRHLLKVRTSGEEAMAQLRRQESR
jgi:hypothetical protein